jgi:hypothetical protein
MNSPQAPQTRIPATQAIVSSFLLSMAEFYAAFCLYSLCLVALSTAVTTREAVSEAGFEMAWLQPCRKRARNCIGFSP